MTTIFLRMEARHLLLLLFGPYVVSLFLALLLRGSVTFFISLTASSAVMCLGSFLFWLRGPGVYLSDRTTKGNTRANRLFRVCHAYVSAYVALFIAFFIWASTITPDPRLVIAIFPLHLLAVICLYYGLQFVPKKLVSSQKGKKSPLRRPRQALFLLIIYPLGVWFIQPMINRMCEKGWGTQPRR